MATAEAYPYERDMGEFDRTVRDAQRIIMAQIEAALKGEDLRTAVQRRLQLSRVIATLDQLGGDVDPMARKLVEDAYEQGAARAAQQIQGLSITAPEIPDAFAGVSRDAVAALQDSITGRLRDARGIVGREVDDIYAQAGRRAALRAVLGAEGSVGAARKQMVADLMKDRDVKRAIKKGGTGFIDKSGRSWDLRRYCEMVVRTNTRQAVVRGAVDRMVSHGVSLARISTHATACKICMPYEGRLVDLAGDTKDFEGEAVMTGPLPPFHPNCTHNVAPVAMRIERIRRELARAEP